MRPTQLGVLVACAAMVLLTAASCGGGGADGGGTGTATGFTSYGNGTLPGRLLLTTTGNGADLYDLGSGTRLKLSETSHPVGTSVDVWTVGGSTRTALRYLDTSGASGNVALEFIDTGTWKPGADLTIPKSLLRPKLSPDGRYILTFWQDSTDTDNSLLNPLTIFDAGTGRVVKRGSTMPDDAGVVGTPAAWISNTRYAYLNGNELYVSSVTDPDDHRVAALDLPGDQPVGSSGVSASPDGQRLAFSWQGDIWVVNVDGTGLRQLTARTADAALVGGFMSATWSPDGQWVAALMGLPENAAAPVYPNPEDTTSPAYQVVGSTGCSSPVLVFAAAAPAPVTVAWPTWDAAHGVKVKNSDGTRKLWLSNCNNPIYWLP